MASKAWVKWIAPGAAVLVAAMATAVDASAARKAILVLLQTSGTGCAEPSGSAYTAVAEGLDANNNVVCSAYTTGTTAWQYCTGTNVTCSGNKPTKVRASFTLVESTSYTTTNTYCVGTTQTWGGATSTCSAIFGSCTWTANAMGMN